MESSWVKSFRCCGLTGNLPIVVFFSFGMRNISSRFEQPVVVKLGFQRGKLQGFLGLPGCAAVKQFGLVQAIDRLSQRVFLADTSAAHRGFDASLGQPLAVPIGHVLRPPVAVMDQGIGALRLPVVQSLFQRTQHEVRSHGTTLAPAHNPTRIDINDKRQVLPTLPGRDVCEVRHPQLIGAV